MNPLSCLFGLGLCFGSPGTGTPGADVVERAVTAVVAGAKRPAWQPDKATEVLVLTQAFYDGTKDLAAEFQQNYWNPSYGTRTRAKGKLKLKKPGMMVWDYDGKNDADYVADGEDLMMVEHDTRQVIRTKIEENNEVLAAMKFLFGGQKLIREFEVRYAKDDRVEKYGDGEHHVLELKPKNKNPHYKGLVLVVHHTTGRVDQFVVYNQDGSSNHFTLRNVRTNKGVADGAFTLRVPDGYVETRE
jgi:outer membrane lipoprotein carrier protein